MRGVRRTRARERCCAQVARDINPKSSHGSSLHPFIDNAHRDLWGEIKTKKALDDQLRARLHAVSKEFKERYTAEHAVSANA